MSVKRLGNKKYEIRGSVPTSTGKYHYYFFRKSFNSINEAREYELKYKESFNIENHTIENHSYTLKEFIDVYDLAKANQLKSSTKQSNTYISKYFESLYDEKIQSLTSGQIKQITDAAFKKGLSEEYVNKMLTYLNKIFNYGLEMGYVQFNPVKRIPKYKRPDKIIDEDDFYTPDEFEQFIQCFPRNKENGEYVCYVIVNLLYFMGCRFGECVALTMNDIDMDKGTIRFNKTVARYVQGRSYLVTPPKTRNSIRTITMPKRMKCIMQEYLDWYKDLYCITKDTFLFGVDRPVLAKVVKKRMAIACERSGIRMIKIHGFRRSNASLLCNANAPVSLVAKRLGHTQFNPVKRIPKYKRPDKIIDEDDFYTPDEFEQFIQCFPRNKENGEYVCYVIVNLLYFMGCRFGECVALTMNDIDMDKGTIRFNKTVARYVQGRSYLVTPPKTRNSIRTITMPKRMKCIMQEYLDWYKDLYCITKDTFLFGVDRPVLAKVVKKRMAIACERSGIRMIKIHGFRRSNASLLCNANAPVSLVAKRLGHTQTECLKTYVKFFNNSEQDLIDIIDSQFE